MIIINCYDICPFCRLRGSRTRLRISLRKRFVHEEKTFGKILLMIALKPCVFYCLFLNHHFNAPSQLEKYFALSDLLGKPQAVVHGAVFRFPRYACLHILNRIYIYRLQFSHFSAFMIFIPPSKASPTEC